MREKTREAKIAEAADEWYSAWDKYNRALTTAREDLERARAIYKRKVLKANEERNSNQKTLDNH